MVFGDTFPPADARYPGNRFVKGFLSICHAGLMAVNIQLDADGPDECFIHKMSILQPSLAAKKGWRGFLPIAKNEGSPLHEC